MTIEELLIPRWKVIAEYPNSIFDVGNILVNNSTQNEYEYISWKDYGKDVYYPNDYPTIFKKLEWWEDRNIKDLPEYVKKIDTEAVYKVFWNRYKNPPKCIGIWFNRKGIDVCFNGQDQDFSLLTIYEPATEQEYLNQNKNDTITIC